MKVGTVDKILKIVKESGVIRPRDLEPHGISRKYLTLMYRKGLLNRVGRGLYVSSDIDPTEYHTIAEVCKRVPGGVVCLLSALQFHDLTTQMPFCLNTPKAAELEPEKKRGFQPRLYALCTGTSPLSPYPIGTC